MITCGDGASMCSSVVVSIVVEQDNVRGGCCVVCVVRRKMGVKMSNCVIVD